MVIHGRLSLLATLLIGACASSGPTSVTSEPETLNNSSPSFWSDPPPIEYLDYNWEDWPSWGDIGFDITPISECNINAPESFERPETNEALVNGNFPWELNVASWNVLNLGTRKAYFNKNPQTERVALMDRIAVLAMPYDVIFFEELLQDWQANFPLPLSSRLPQHTCQLIVPYGGWAGRKESYGVCYRTSNPSLTSIAVTSATSAGLNVTNPVSNTQYCAPRVWMRPPGLVNVTVLPTGDPPVPVSFNFQVNHIKPSYNRKFLPGGGKNPKTPAWYPAQRPASFPAPTQGAATWPLPTSSVFLEMKALANNMAHLGTNNNIIVGDMNADCSYLAGYQRQGLNAVLPGWIWTITESTNVGRVRANAQQHQVQSHCIYDQFILDQGAQQYNRGASVQESLIADRLNRKQVSDHYLIKLTLAGGQLKKTTGKLTVTVASKRQRSVDTKNIPPGSTTSTSLGGSKIKRANTSSGNNAQLFVTTYKEDTRYGDSNKIKLTDVRGAPTPVTIDVNDNLLPKSGHSLNWSISDLDGGTYKLVLDINGDNWFEEMAGDLVNSPTSFDFLVYDNSMIVKDGEINTVGDNGRSRDFFSSGKALSVYALADNVTATGPAGTVNAYVVSMKKVRQLYPAFTDWESAKNGTPRINLDLVAIPVNSRKNPLILDNLVRTDKYRVFQAAADKTLFADVWSEPAVLFSARVYQNTPPTRYPVTDADYEKLAIYGDACASTVDSATGLSEESYSTICNSFNTFSQYFGDQYTVALDNDVNGYFDHNDQSGNPNIGPINTFFAGGGSPVIGSNQNVPKTVVENYQNLLLSRLNKPVGAKVTPGVYDSASEKLSELEYCQSSVTRITYNEEIHPDTQIGFFLLSETDYQINKDRRRFINVDINLEALADTKCVVVEEQLMASNINYTQDVHFHSFGGTNLSGEHNVSSDDATVRIAHVHDPDVPVLKKPLPAIVIEPNTHLIIEDTVIKAAAILLLIVLL